MAIVNCKECGKEISDMAQTCPHCGVVLKKDTFSKEMTALKRIAIFLIVVLLIVTAYFWFIY